MDKVKSAFYKNVNILIQLISPSEDLKKCFKEGMFDKPNTSGFIHVSYYLLSIYYKDSIKKKVIWPIVDRQTDERQFRNDVKECLESISLENSDLSFPAILPTHLIQASGTKFLLIMWKFSIAVLRIHLKRDCGKQVLHCPKPGNCQDITNTFLKNLTKSNSESTVVKIKKTEEMDEEVNNYKEEQTKIQNKLKQKMGEVKDELKQVVASASVNKVAQERLMDVNDTEIIKLWKDTLEKDIETFERMKNELKIIEQEFEYVINIIRNITGDASTLDGSNLEKINIEKICKLLPYHKQVLPCNLYTKQGLNLLNFFQLFNDVLKVHEKHREKIGFPDFSKALIQLQISNEDLKKILEHMHNLDERIVNFAEKEVEKYEVQVESLDVSGINKEIFMPSPAIEINNHDNLKPTNLNYLELTPVEGAHKELFSRHVRRNMGTDLLKKSLPVRQINFDEPAFKESRDNTDRIFQSMKLPFSPKITKPTKSTENQYSRIFSKMKLNDNIVNNSMMMMVKPLISSKTSKTFSNESFSQDPMSLEPTSNSTFKSNVESCSADEDQSKQKKRRSISDLVERYQKILQERNSSKTLCESENGEQSINLSGLHN